MIVTCPACSVRYLVDSRALGAKGRTVRCARCAHTWHQDVPEDAVAPVDPASPAPPPPPSPERTPVLTSEDRIRLPALATPPRRRGMAIVWVAAIVVVIAGLIAGAIYERGLVASLVPGAARFYALAGIPVRDSSPGLVFRNVTTSRDMQNGLPSLVIKGEVANVSSVALAVPKLVAILRDRNERELSQQSFAVPAARLMPGETTPFQTTISQPAEEAAGVVVIFAGGGG
jgi:predicted Zn finger-like uncharacterized protein